jgi:hypothetical protein
MVVDSSTFCGREIMNMLMGAVFGNYIQTGVFMNRPQNFRDVWNKDLNKSEMIMIGITSISIFKSMDYLVSATIISGISVGIRSNYNILSIPDRDIIGCCVAPTPTRNLDMGPYIASNPRTRKTFEAAR